MGWSGGVECAVNCTLGKILCRGIVVQAVLGIDSAMNLLDWKPDAALRRCVIDLQMCACFGLIELWLLVLSPSPSPHITLPDPVIRYRRRTRGAPAACDIDPLAHTSMIHITRSFISRRASPPLTMSFPLMFPLIFLRQCVSIRHPKEGAGSHLRILRSPLDSGSGRWEESEVSDIGSMLTLVWTPMAERVRLEADALAVLEWRRWSCSCRPLQGNLQISEGNEVDRNVSGSDHPESAFVAYATASAMAWRTSGPGLGLPRRCSGVKVSLHRPIK